MLFIINIVFIFYLGMILNVVFSLTPLNFYYLFIALVPVFMVYWGTLKIAQKEKKHSCKNVLIYGTYSDGRVIQYAIKYLLTDHHLNILGFIDENALNKEKGFMGYPIFSSQDQLPHLLKHGDVDYIVIGQDLKMSVKLEKFLSGLPDKSIKPIQLEINLNSLISGYLRKDNTSPKIGLLEDQTDLFNQTTMY